MFRNVTTRMAECVAAGAGLRVVATERPETPLCNGLPTDGRKGSPGKTKLLPIKPSSPLRSFDEVYKPKADCFSSVLRKRSRLKQERQNSFDTSVQGERKSPGAARPSSTNSSNVWNQSLSYVDSVDDVNESSCGDVVARRRRNAFQQSEDEINNEVAVYLERLQRICSSSKEQFEVEDLRVVSREFHSYCAECNLLGRYFSRRKDVLKQLFQCLSVAENDESLAAVIKFIYAFEISALNAIVVNKILYRLTKTALQGSKANGRLLFLDQALVENCLKSIGKFSKALSTPNIDDGELSNEEVALMFTVASLKAISNMTDDHRTLVVSSSNGHCVPFCAKILNVYLSLPAEDLSELDSNRLQILSQLLGLLRNMVEHQDGRLQFLQQTELFHLVCRAVSSLSEDIVDLSCRILSKLSACYSTKSVFSGEQNQRDLLSITEIIMNSFRCHGDIIRHLCFTVGNVAAFSTEFRLLFCEQEVIVLGPLIETFSFHSSENNAATTESVEKTADILTKMLTMFANLTMEEAWVLFLIQDDYLSSFQRCLKVEADSVAIPALVTLHNVAYWAVVPRDNSVLDPTTTDDFMSQALALCTSILPWLESNNDGVVIEAMHLLSVLLHYRLCRKFFHRQIGMSLLLRSVSPSKRDLFYVCCGCVLNLLIEDDRHNAIVESSFLPMVFDVLCRDRNIDDSELVNLLLTILLKLSSTPDSLTLRFYRKPILDAADVLRNADGALFDAALLQQLSVLLK